jgi:hypothetical protein
MDNLTGKYIRAGYSVKQVRKFLQDRRAKLSAENPISSFHAGNGTSGSDSVDSALSQARSLSANSNGTLSESKALELVVRRNPSIYEAYEDERLAVDRQGTHKAIRDYVTGHQSRYIQSLGLSSTLAAVPKPVN